MSTRQAVRDPFVVRGGGVANGMFLTCFDQLLIVLNWLQLDLALVRMKPSAAAERVRQFFPAFNEDAFKSATNGCRAEVKSLVRRRLLCHREAVEGALPEKLVLRKRRALANFYYANRSLWGDSEAPVKAYYALVRPSNLE